jgi:serine/threonine protein kinase
LPEYLALSILEDIIKGYGHLAANNILHRDIKPANIFLSNGRAKIADFGFAMTKKYDLSLFSDVFAKSHTVGSPLYMPP